ncbi:MAG: hypothetical protein ABI629_05445 [bacterium]
MELRMLRNRLNGLVLQHAASLTVATGVVLATMLVVLALRAGSPLFSTAAWAGGALGVGLTFYLTWHVRRAWLSMDDAAYLADRRGGLEGLLTTALADPAPHSPLRPLLLDQVRAATPRWRTAALAPQRVARSVLLIPAALAILVAAAFYARPPARLVRATQPWLTQSQQLMVPAVADPSSPLIGHPENANLGQAAGGTADDDAGAHSVNGAPSTSGHGDNQAIGSVTSSASTGTQTGADQLRDAIRRTLGAGTETTSSGPGSSATTPSDGIRKHDGHDADAPSEADASRAPAGRDEAAETHKAPPDSPNEKSAGAIGSEGRGGTGRSGNGNAAGELFDSKGQAAGAAGGGGAKPIAIKLGAFAAAEPQQGEPQRQPAAPIAANATSAGGRTQLPDLATVQAPDAALQKLDIAPEHEAFIRRIFTRQ